MNTSMPSDDVAAAFRRAYQVVVDATELPSDQVPMYRATQQASDRRYRWAVALGVVAVVLVLAGTALFGDNSPPAQSDQLEGFRAHPSGSAGGMDAIVSGVVEIDMDAGCVWLSDPDGARYPVLWPAGTVAQAEPPAIRLPDGQLVQSGDRIEGGGGYVNADMATSGLLLDPFPSQCVQVGEAATFNASSAITVFPGEGLDVEETLVARFSSPESIGLELIAVNANQRSVAVVDFVTGTVHQYGPDQYEAPADAIDGASGGGGFTHLWANGTVSTYWPIDGDPLVYQPEPLREVSGIAPTLEVLPAPDGDHTWLVQPGFDSEPTLVELVNVVGFELDRQMSTEIGGVWHPMGATMDGLILSSDDSGQLTRLVRLDGSVGAEVEGTALSVSWHGVVILRPDGSLILTDARLEDPRPVEKPGEGIWASVGGPVVPATSPPIRTGGDRYLVMLADGSAGSLVVIDALGVATIIDEVSGAPLASWSRDGRWVVVVEGSSVTLVSREDGSVVPLGDLIPDSHFVLTAG
ncbi:MAG: hypothetical protein WD274_13650 [Acidimicrobiia bacterium]